MSAAERRQSRRSLIEYSSPIPMWYSDAETEQIVDANDAALQFWRYDRSQFIGMRATQLLEAEELPRQKKAAQRNLWGETGPWKCRRGDGSRLYATVRWQRITHMSRLCDFVFVATAGDSLTSLERLLGRQPASNRSGAHSETETPPSGNSRRIA